MISLPIFKRSAVERLWHHAVHKPEIYQEAIFDIDGELIKDDVVQAVANVGFDPNLFAQLTFPADAGSVGRADAQNALLLFQELKGMTPKIARDERVWCAVGHMHAKDFIWERHVRGTSPEEVSRKIQTQFFCRTNGANRGFERDNALSSLWWWAFMASKVKSLKHSEALEILLEFTDFRDAVLGRPTTSIIPQVLEALILIFVEERKSDPEVAFFRRKKKGAGGGGNYRDLLVEIDLHGGRALYDVMSVEDLTDLFWSLRKALN